MSTQTQFPLMAVIAIMLTFGCSHIDEDNLTKNTYLEYQSSSDNELQFHKAHIKWAVFHNRNYSSVTEEQRHFQTFKTNLVMIKKLNGLKRSFQLKMNQFGDLTNAEFQAQYLTYNKSTRASRTDFKYQNVSDVPTSWDWRKEGAVTPVKDQRRCGSCWPFSAVAAVEGLTKIKKGTFVSLSEQELVDCDQLDSGCVDGIPDWAFEFIKESGLTTEEAYPYQAQNATCQIERP